MDFQEDWQDDLGWEWRDVDEEMQFHMEGPGDPLAPLESGTTGRLTHAAAPNPPHEMNQVQLQTTNMTQCDICRM